MADEDEVVVLEHPELTKDDPDAVLTFRRSDGFWNDKLDQIEVYKQAGWRPVSKTRAASIASDTTTGETKK